MKQIVICIILLLSILLWLILDNLNSFYINAEFKELKPLPPIIIVHYKGIKVGKVVSSKHSTDFEHTILRIKLHPKKLNLPANSIAKLMIEKRKFYHYDYIEIIKPEEASKDRLKQNDTIKGFSTIDAKNFLANQDKETLEQIKTNLYNASENLNTTIEGIGALVSILTEIANENQTNIKNFSSELAKTGQNLENITKEFDNSINQKDLNNSIKNIENSLKQFDELSLSLKNNSHEIEANLPEILENIKILTKNTGQITTSLKNTLNKPFGGLRLLFKHGTCN